MTLSDFAPELLKPFYDKFGKDLVDKTLNSLLAKLGDAAPAASALKSGLGNLLGGGLGGLASKVADVGTDELKKKVLDQLAAALAAK